ncbi:DUF2254 domain-containing protein [Dokdonia sp. LLG6352-1]|uniref:DUF2254 domain-containing protein n=1 Tax=Dokdonia sp. LLG6352-1 TaxID=3160831 RepID=UPI00386674DC
MNKLYTKLELLYSRITGNVAFYPSLIAFMGLALGFFMSYAEQQGISKYLIDTIPALVINDADTARTLLSTFIGGIFSLMVFSFSMVMLILNQASSNYSPRILPGLIANKRHQVVLGFYIAVIIYCIIILLSIEPEQSKTQLPGFAVLIGIVLSIHVLAAFIYFIHSISQAIQINNIIDRIYKVSRDRIQQLIDTESDPKGVDVFKDNDSWQSYTTKFSGHLNDIALDSLVDFCNEHSCKVSLLVPKGSFVLDSTKIVSVNKDLDEEAIEALRSCFGFSRSEIVKNNYILGFKQLTEIAVKAMSPGINDPGTAITCLDYLTELFVLRMQKRDNSFVTDKDGNALVSLRTINFEEVLYFIFASLRQYCKADFIMLHKMLQSLRYLSTSDALKDEYTEAIINQVQLIIDDANQFIKNESDRAILNKVASEVQTS